MGLTGKYRLLTAANLKLVPVWVLEEECVVTRTVIFANFRPLKIFPTSVAHELGNAIHFFARVCPKRDPRVVGFMFFVPGKAKEFRWLVATRGIERMVSPGFFMNESQLWQKFSVKLFRRFHICHPQIDMIEATRFHFVILNRIAWQFNRAIAKIGGHAFDFAQGRL